MGPRAKNAQTLALVLARASKEKNDPSEDKADTEQESSSILGLKNK